MGDFSKILFFPPLVDIYRHPFLIIYDLGCKPKWRHTAPAFKTIFNQVLGLVRNQHQLPSRRMDFNARTYFVTPKTCYCQQQSSQYPIFPSQARDQSFTRVVPLISRVFDPYCKLRTEFFSIDLCARGP